MNKSEREALRGLPFLSRMLYHESIRPRMDYGTGVVGLKSGISWWCCTEDLEVEGSSGIRYDRPSVDQVRRAAKHLQKRGLIEICTKKSKRKLVLKCLLATTDKSAQNKAASKPPDKPATIKTVEPPVVASLPANSDTETQHVKNSQSRHTSDIRIYMIDCVSRTRSSPDFENPEQVDHAEEFSVSNEGNFSPEVFKTHVADYLSYCRTHHYKPSQTGLKNLLKTRMFFKEQNRKTQHTRETLYDARRSKINALAIRELDIADNIHDENIARRRKAGMW